MHAKAKANWREREKRKSDKKQKWILVRPKEA
jgi:hypothetical protein